MRPIPDIDNSEAMAAWGRRSALMSAWNNGKEALRDATVRCQSVDGLDDPDIQKHAEAAIEAAQRILDVAGIWKHVDKGGLVSLLQASIDKVKK